MLVGHKGEIWNEVQGVQFSLLRNHSVTNVRQAAFHTVLDSCKLITIVAGKSSVHLCRRHKDENTSHACVGYHPVAQYIIRKIADLKMSPEELYSVKGTSRRQCHRS